jgi:large subunit ribosomal protein L15
MLGLNNMLALNNLENERRPKKARKRVGRGPRSGTGKTAGRGHKGTGARSGAQRRFTYEGGQMRLFMKMPQRGFSQARFRRPFDVVNLGLIDRYYTNGEVVDEKSLRRKRLISNRGYGIKILGKGGLEKSKPLRIEVDALSASAMKKVIAAGIPVVLKGSRPL